MFARTRAMTTQSTKRGRAFSEPSGFSSMCSKPLVTVAFVSANTVMFCSSSPPFCKTCSLSGPPTLRLAERPDDLDLVLYMAAVMGAHAGVAVAESGGNLVIIGACLPLASGGECRAEPVLGEAGTDESFSFESLEEVAGLLLQLLGTLPWLTVVAQRYLAVRRSDLQRGEILLKLGHHRQPMYFVILAVTKPEAFAELRIVLIIRPAHSHD